MMGRMLEPEEQDPRKLNAARFAHRCREVAPTFHVTIDTNRGRGPFVAEWSVFPTGEPPFVGIFRVRLVCGRRTTAIRVFSGSLSYLAAVDLAFALQAAARVAEAFAGEDCGGTPAEIAEAHRREEPLGTRGIVSHEPPFTRPARPGEETPPGSLIVGVMGEDEPGGAS